MIPYSEWLDNHIFTSSITFIYYDYCIGALPAPYQKHSNGLSIPFPPPPAPGVGTD